MKRLLDSFHQRSKGETRNNRDHPPGGCALQVVLLCSGNGADASSYRPRRDESQWWNRRDALVRCVTAFLFGPTSPSARRRELVLLYDGDHTHVHMTAEYDNDDDAVPFVPTEHAIIALWKEATTKALQGASIDSSTDNRVPVVVRLGPICCWVLLAHPKIVDNNSNRTGGYVSNHAGSITHGGIQNLSKRQVLEYLQKHCTMDFLRSQGLNSAPDVILRKSNRKALLQVYHTWIKQQQQQQQHQRQQQNGSNKKKTSNVDTGSLEQSLKEVFQDVIQSFSRSQRDDTQSQQPKLLVATLHESSDAELPCFGLDDDHDGPDEIHLSQPPLHVCLVLGAVRDMTSTEYQVLQKACGKSAPMLRVRLGKVPEFTSKILSVVAFHHAHQTLGPALLRLEQGRRDDTSNAVGPSRDINQTAATSTPPGLHVLCLIPMRSDQVVTALEDRDRCLWCLVRIMVCSLWRSRLASGKHSSGSAADSAHSVSQPLENVLTLVFGDGSYLTLLQHELVSSLAEQHQAAPSEFQVLNALVQMIANHTNPHVTTSGSHENASGRGPFLTRQKWSARAEEILQEVMTGRYDVDGFGAPLTQCMISIEPGASNQLAHLFFSSDTCPDRDNIHGKTVFVLLPVGLDIKANRDDKLHQMLKDTKQTNHLASMLGAFHQACRAQPNLVLLRQSLLPEPRPTDSSTNTDIDRQACQDFEASSVTMLQHLAYQNRLLQILPTLTTDRPAAPSARRGICGDAKHATPSRKQKRRRKSHD